MTIPVENIIELHYNQDTAFTDDKLKGNEIVIEERDSSEEDENVNRRVELYIRHSKDN